MKNRKNVVKDPQIELLKKDKTIKLERLQYQKNRIPALLSYLGIIFNVVYYIGIYKINDVYFYKFIIFASVILNLLFLLFGFLSSEGIKSYKKNYAFVLMGLGALQIARIFIFPLGALNAGVITAEKFTRCLIYLLISSGSMIIAGIYGLLKVYELDKSLKLLEKESVK